MTCNNVQSPCNTFVHCAQQSRHNWNNQCPTLSHAAYFHSQVSVFLQFLSLFLGEVCVCLLISEIDVRTIGTDIPSSRDTDLEAADSLASWSRGMKDIRVHTCNTRILFAYRNGGCAQSW